ncbi:MAG: TRAP transporter small permease [Salinisphaera sp.]|jgi:C4-dicarboxylate transporter DctQ subunit|nr:TRAP transporter small permease [Salinisphaera sp.]
MRLLLDGLSDWLGRVAMTVAALTATVMIGSLLVGVFYRYVLQASLSWTGEIALLSFTWVVLLVSSQGVREGFHVRVTVLDTLLPQRVSRWLHRGLLLAVIGFGLVLAWSGYQFTLFTAQQVSAAIRYPVWIRNASVPVCGLLIAIHGLARMAGSGRIDDA